MADLTANVHITAEDLRPALDQAIREAISTMVHEVARVELLVCGLETRMERAEALAKQYQRVLTQHGERLNGIEALPGVREMLPQDAALPHVAQESDRAV
jgi:hypothetical protein